MRKWFHKRLFFHSILPGQVRILLKLGVFLTNNDD